MGRIYAKGVEIVPGFRLVNLLGRGGFGEVWKATAPGGTDAAVKIISLGERSGVKEYRSIQLVKQIRHPNLVPIIAFWLRNEDGMFLDQMLGDNTIARRAQDLELIIAMGMGEKNLLDRLRECQKEGKSGIPPDELVNYMQDSAKAIDFLNQPIHDLGDGVGGIQHCDIKPQNILIQGGSAVVCDFGLARVLGDSRVTSAKGSAAYMAPELILNNKPSKATDQYCLAISYVELRTGTLPVNINSPAGAIWAHVEGKLDLSKLPPAEQAVIKRAANKDPDKRYSNSVEFVRALRQATDRPAAPKSAVRAVNLDELIKPGNEIVSGYKLIKLLGQGSYGQVWEAIAPGGKHVALKIIRNLESTHGRQEFRALEVIKAVEHNHLIELHAYWLLDKQGVVIPDHIRFEKDAPEPSTLVIASKLASQNLQQRLNEHIAQGKSGIPVPELLIYMKQAAQAIDYLNRPQHPLADRKVSIQHRDIKPENILLAANVVKVGDFGLAKVVEGTSAVIHGESAGLTLAYAAPEMFQDQVTSWTDQYALAITYFKLRTGALPFPVNSKPNDIIKCHMSGKLDLSRLPPDERAVIIRATSLKPESRFPSCMAMVEALDEACRQVNSKVDFGETMQYVPGAVGGRRNQPPSAPAITPVAPPKKASVDPLSIPDLPTGPPMLETAAATPTERVPIAPMMSASVEPILVEPEGSSDLPPPLLLPPKPPVSSRASKAIKATPPPPSGQRPSSVRKSINAVWKDREAAQRAQRNQGLGVVVFLLVVLIILLLGMIFVLTKDKLSAWRKDAGSGNKEVDELLEAGRFAAAWDRLDGLNISSQEQSNYRQRILDEWLHTTEKALADLPSTDHVEESLSEILARVPNDQRAGKLQATSRQVKELRTKMKSATAGSTLIGQLDAASIDPALKKNLRSELQFQWLEQARRALQSNQLEEAVRLSAAITTAFPSSKEAGAIRTDARSALVRRVQAIFDSVERDLINGADFRNAKIKKLLSEAEAQATEFRNLFGTEDPETYLLWARLYELQDAPASAYAAYTTGLHDPARATGEQIDLLLGRIEFNLNRKWAQYLKNVMTARSLYMTIEYTDRALELTSGAMADPTRHARALALGARARYRAINQLPLSESQVDDYQKKAESKLSAAIALAKSHSATWQCTFELARQLHELQLDITDAKERKRIREESTTLLLKAEGMAPEAERELRIRPLLKLWQKQSS